MDFLSGGTVALAAGLTMPPLIALYFLKLRRQPKPISSTLLWKRAVEDLQVNAPFQRIRNNLLLWLQLLILLLAALALGKPIMQARQTSEDTVIVLMDQSASMNVEEAGHTTRLDEAKDQAKTVIDNLPNGSRAMIIGFSDRASVISPFETDKQKLKSRIDDIEATDSSTTMTEAVALAEAYMQNLLIAGDAPGQDTEIHSTAGPARAVILTDGDVADASQLTIKRLPTDSMQVISIGKRSDNVAILSMDTRRNYERPEMLEVFAMVRNFGPEPVSVDAALYINGEHYDVQTMTLEPGRISSSDAGADSSGTKPGGDGGGPPPGSVASVAFDEIRYEGGGIVEVRLNISDALACDNRAYTIVSPPKSVTVLLVSSGNIFLERALDALPLRYDVMSPAQYESASDEDLTEMGRLKYSAVIFDGHSTKRLFPGSYIFMGGVPLIDGVSVNGTINDQIIFNWDESHPILRYVAVDSIQVYQWLDLTLPARAVAIMEGETSPIMALLSDQGRQFLICAFGLLTEDDVTGEPMLNTDWWSKPHFLIFLYNAIQHLSGSLSPRGLSNVRPGEPMQFEVPDGAEEIHVSRPNGGVDRVPTAGASSAVYARTRRVGVYTSDTNLPGKDRFAVNLFDATESDVTPRTTLSLGSDKLTAGQSVQRVNKPVWPYLLMAAGLILALEWIVYSKRVYV